MHTMLLFCAALVVHSAAYTTRHCHRGEWCWPSEYKLRLLRTMLNPDMPRTLEQLPDGPYVSALPVALDGTDVQPLYGLGTEQMEPLYIRTNLSMTCKDERTFDTDFCKAQTTQVYGNADPDFVVFVLTARHVQTTVRFARRHRLCIVVAGSGHEFVGRNQPLHCNGGSILIRTTLMRSKEADLDDVAELGHESFRFGAGMVFAEAQEFAASHGRMIMSGLCPTVGIVGWLLGGGHGPFGPRLGLGVDQLLSASVVLPTGRLVTVTANGPYSDLFRAMRGGGGSTWGIITNIVIKAHPIPADGLTMTYLREIGSMADTSKYEKIVRSLISYQLELPAEVSMGMALYINKQAGVWVCSTWTHIYGGPNSSLAEGVLARLAGMGIEPPALQVIPAANSHMLTPYSPSNNPVRPWSEDSPLNSVLISREQVPQLADYALEETLSCTVSTCVVALGGQLTGNIGSPQDPTASISQKLRTAPMMYLSYIASQEALQEKFGQDVYMSESGPNVPLASYWGDKYDFLRSVKQKYDPRGVFGCRKCISPW
eukprot:TRINITY_DN4105_c0_g1_i3.p1 TRINITY_DN4105_c0_g1~~TRINITY_DN4105_c0_g1_i3.p1  ORF type:complete len:555 (+),score=210.49 TRINITY_DN4105_c0_g1_i3:41-1666(+)